MKRIKVFGLILAIAIIVGEALCPKNVCRIVQDNTEQVPVEIKTGITEEEFNAVLTEFINVNQDLAKEKGFELVIINRWDDSTVNANTTVFDKFWIINAFGGLARFPGMTADAYTMVLCHELGHHLGGFPAVGWASNEGQSDYYAAAKCFPRMAASKKKAKNVDEVVKKQCSLSHKSRRDIQICEKTSMTGFELASVLNALSRMFAPIDCVLDPLKPAYCPENYLTDISFSTPDQIQVETTYNGHPQAQCRLDTYFAGAVCNVPHDEDFSPDNALVGACAEEKGDKLGVRPHCWYRPGLFF